MSARTIDNIGWARRLRVYGFTVLLAACTGEIDPPASPLVEETRQGLGDPSNEELTLANNNRVQIRRDSNGVPHISARTEADGYFALCYAEAEDRLFQLDYLRRNGQGRLAELFGHKQDDAFIAGDVFARVLNVPGLASARYSKMSHDAQTLLEACAAGINLFISKGSLPPEFKDLGYAPDEWKPADSLAISMGIAMNLDTGIFLTKLQASAIASSLDLGDLALAVSAALVPSPPALSMFDASGKLNPVSQYQTPAPAKSPVRKPTKALNGKRLPRGWRAPERRSTGLGSDTSGPESNNYAIDGNRSKSKHPLVANDPHLPLTTPSLAYAAQLQVDRNLNGKPMNVQGITFPGLPLFVSARTDTTSWAITFLLLDDVDLYLEMSAPTSSRSETIQVAGDKKNPIVVQIDQSVHGPVLNAAFPELDAAGKIALKTTMADDKWSIEGLMNLPRTTSWKEFQKSARQCSIGFNFLYSDETGDKGHIGYQASGLAPIRPPSTQGLPLPDAAYGVVFDDGSAEWTGFVPAEKLPSVYDPPAHVLATGNNRIVPDEFPIYLSNFYDLPWRAQRLYTRLLNSSTSLTTDDFAKVQLDTYSVFNLPFRDTLVASINSPTLASKGRPAMDALTALTSWDGNVDANSQGAAVYETMQFVLLSDTVSNVLGSLFAGYSSSVFITQQLQALRDIVESPRAPFFGIPVDASQDDANKARDAAVRAAFDRSCQLLRAAIGDDVSKWSWGKVHKLKYNHPLVTKDDKYKIGSFGANGDASTPWIGGFFLKYGLLATPDLDAKGVKQALTQDALQVVRVIWEPSNKDRSRGVLSTGESGDPGSTHFADQADDWRAGNYLDFPYSR